MNAPSQSANPARIPRRPYGDTGEMLSVLGFGAIVVMNEEQATADEIVAEAVERGVNYFDVAPGYGDAESKLGPALEPYRKDAFLACKTGQRTAEGAAAELAQSLERLRTDHLDLYQLHGLCDVANDVDVAFGPGGAMEVLVAARKSGQVRHLGFSAHTTDASLAAMDRFDFDSILFPVNFTCWLNGGHGEEILRAAERKGVARLALKAMAREKWSDDHTDRQTWHKCWYRPASDPREAALALRWSLSQPITAAVSPGMASLFRLALDIAADPQPLTPEETQELTALARTLQPIFP